MFYISKRSVVIQIWSLATDTRGNGVHPVPVVKPISINEENERTNIIHKIICNLSVILKFCVC